MGIDYIRKKVYERKLKQTATASAKEQYDSMKVAIASIANSPGLDEIVRYWERQKDLHEGRLEEIKTLLVAGEKVDQNHINTVLVSHGIADKFLTFLVNMLSD